MYFFIWNLNLLNGPLSEGYLKEIAFGDSTNAI